MLLEFDGTFIFALISFIIFVLVMNVILYRPVMKIITERQKFYDKNQNTALQSKQKAEKILNDKKAQILSAKLEASDILTSTQSKVKSTRDEVIKSKKEDIKNKLISNEADLLNQKIKTKEELKKEVETYVNMVVSKVLDENIEDIKLDETRLEDALKACGGNE